MSQKISTPITWKGILGSAKYKQKSAVTKIGFLMTGLVFPNGPGVKPQKLKLRIYSQVWLGTVNAFYTKALKHEGSRAAAKTPTDDIYLYFKYKGGKKPRGDWLLKLP